jgi:predicted CxxxxCH...CXXCH cytochrome family protein
MTRVQHAIRLARALAAMVASVAALVALPASAQTTTIADGLNPGDANPWCPGQGPVAVDSFVLSATPADQVTRIQLQLRPLDAYVNLERIEIRGDGPVATAPLYGSAIPNGETVSIPLTTPIAATSTPVQYHVVLVPKPHLDMPPAKSGRSFAIQAVVSVFNATNYRAGTDASSSTVTVDNGSPSDVLWSGITTTAGSVTLSWAGTPDVLVLRRLMAPVQDVPVEGATYSVGATLGASTVVAQGVRGSVNDTTVVTGKGYYYRVFVRDGCGNWSVGSQVGPVIPGGTGEGDLTQDSTKPVVGLLNPLRGAVSSPVRVQVRVYSPKLAGATQPIGTVTLYVDDGTSVTSQALVRNPNYGTAVDSGVFEVDAAGTTGLALTKGKTYMLRAQASNASGAVYSGWVGVDVGTGKGDGRLLVRDNSDQLCTDCHAMKSHSSEDLGAGYGSWYVGCRACHEPHNTWNASLVAKEITPPSVNGTLPPAQVFYAGGTGYSAIGGKSNPGAGSYANADGTGPCQVCHTRTTVFNRTPSPADVSHSGGKTCKDCHDHSKGMATTCTSCHGDPARVLTANAEALASAAPPKSAPPTSSTDPLNKSVGEHLAHVNRATFRSAPIRCAECHPIPNVHNDTPGNADVQWGTTAANGTTPLWNPVAGTCATTYCHGATLTGGAASVNWMAGDAFPVGAAACAQCHGAPPALNASSPHPVNVSCASCHGAGYATAGITGLALDTHLDRTINVTTSGCTSCHGDLSVANVTPQVPATLPNAAPGSTASAVDAAGNTAATFAGVGAHKAHVVGRPEFGSGVGCGACHAVPVEGDTSHATGASATPSQGSRATVTFSAIAAGLVDDSMHAPASATPAAYAGSATQSGGSTAGSCVTYCHGNFGWKNPDTGIIDYGYGAAGQPVSMSWTSTTDLTCNSCHGTSAGAQATHPGGNHQTDDNCGSCHAGYTRTSVNAANHLNGKAISGVDYVPRSATSNSCTGCHGDTARASVPSTTQDAFGQPLGKVSPPKDAQSGAWTNSYGIGAHEAHVNQADLPAVAKPIECTICHGTVPTTTSPSGTHQNGTPNTQFTGIAAGTTYNAITHDCSTSYCHGNFAGGNAETINWGTGALAKRSCTTCHGAPPPAPHVQNTSCGTTGCHAGYTSSTVDVNKHVNGTVDLDTVNPLSCSTCHGVAVRAARGAGTSDAKLAAAPPTDTTGSATGNVVGPHLGHVWPDPAQPEGQIWKPVACVECHPSNVQTYAVLHENGTREVPFGTPTAANLGGVTPSWTPGSPGSCTTYCHGATFAANQKGTVTGAWQWNASTVTCGSCHGASPADPVHTSVSKTALATACNACHNTTVDGAGNIIFTSGTTLHINGTRDIGGVTCHSCHGDAISDAPPPPANSANTNAAGAHRKHVVAGAGNLILRSTAYACTQCHVDNGANMRHASGGVPEMVWTASDAPTTVWTDATSSCATSYCHGANATFVPAGASSASSTWGGTKTAPVWTTVDGSFKVCSACHGAPPALTANTHHPANPTCDKCHPAGATATTMSGTALTVHVNKVVNLLADRGCAMCHGDLNAASAVLRTDARAAPGYNANAADTLGNTSATLPAAVAVGKHNKHLLGTTFRPGGAAVCGDCHQVPAVDTDRTHATGVNALGQGSRATVTFGTFSQMGSGSTSYGPTYTGSTTGGGTNTAGTCSNTYCHGAKWVGNANYEGTAAGMAPSFTGAAMVCGSCHQAPPNSGNHAGVVAGNTNCQGCHTGYNCFPATLAACVVPANHLDGTSDALASLSCTSCHGTNGRTNTAAIGPFDAHQDAAPPVPTSGGGVNETGPHQAHVNPNPAQAERQIFIPVACSECHTNAVNTYTTGHSGNGVQVAFGDALYSNRNSVVTSFADGVSPNPGTCSATYCHGTSFPAAVKGSVATWQWDATTTVTCGSCHKAAPADAVHTSVGTGAAATACNKCHDQTVDAAGKIKIVATSPYTTHIDGTVQTSATLGCTSCHGTSGVNAAPPTGLHASETTTASRHVGAHQSHVTTTNTGNVAWAFDCDQCHPKPSTNTHANAVVGAANPAEMIFAASPGTGTVYNSGANPPTCTGYCHGSGTAPAAVWGTARNQTNWGGLQRTPQWTNVTGTYRACTACHGTVPPLNADTHHPQNTSDACSTCHGSGYTSTAVTGAAQTTHVDGSPTKSRSGCTLCHGDLTKTGILRTGLEAAPGWFNGTAVAGKDTAGSTTGNQVSAHRAHLQNTTLRSGSVACGQCHTPLGSDTDVAHATGVGNGVRATITFGSEATQGGSTPTYASLTCTGTYCHGAKVSGGSRKNPVWTDTAAVATACGSCHSNPPLVPHPQNTGCSGCHAGYATTGITTGKSTHINGLADARPTITCVACHGELSASAAIGGSNTTDARIAPGYSDTAVDTKGNTNLTGPLPTGVGVHQAHVNPASGAGLNIRDPIACTVCHPAKAAGDKTHANGTVNFTWSSPATAMSTTPTWASPSCTNYCHSNAGPLTSTGTNSALTKATMSWTTTTNNTCTSCHNNVARTSDTGTQLSQRHAKHGVNGTTYNFDCSRCHAATGTKTSITNKANHVNGAKNVAFGTIGTADQSAGVWTSTSSTPNYTCASTYCHSNGSTATAPFGAPNTALAWTNGTSSATCDSCHGGNASATTKMAAGSHAAHMNKTGYTGNFACGTCHANTVALANDRAISTVAPASYASHVNAVKDVTAGSWASGTKTCASNYCHSSGQATPTYYSVTWGSTTLADDCKGCHGRYVVGSGGEFVTKFGEPNYTNGGQGAATANSHGAHVAVAADCYTCHFTTVTSAGNVIATGGLHQNGTRNIVFDTSKAGSATYDPATKTCSNVSCHPSPNRIWGQTGVSTCLSCHGIQQSGTYTRARIVGLTSVSTNNTDGDDFIRSSRHVSNGTTTAIVKNADCVLCHAEGNIASSTAGTLDINPVRDTSFHYTAGGSGTLTVDLRDVDSSNGTGIAARWPAQRKNATSYTTLTSFDRDQMDWFCLTCHDGDGAAGVSVNSANTGFATQAGIVATAVSRTTTVVTVTTAAAPGLVVGDAVNLTSAIPSAGGTAVDYKPGIKTVASVGANSFTYNEAGSALSSRSVTATFRRYVPMTATGLTRASSTVTVTTATAHGFVVGDVVALTPGQDLFRGGWKTIATVPTTTTFTYTEAGTAGTIPSGTQYFVKTSARAKTPFNTSDTLRNGREGTSHSVYTWRGTNNKIINVKSQFNSDNLAGSSFASHHNLNQFTKRYTTKAIATGAWAAYTTKDGVLLNSTTTGVGGEVAGLHCADCHLNETNAHGSRNTWYMLASSAAGSYGDYDVAFTNLGTSTSTDVCGRCHAGATYGYSGGSSTNSRTSAHQACTRLGDFTGSLLRLGSAYSGSYTTPQIPCLGCHGGNGATNLGPGLIHGTNETYKPLNSTGTSKMYRFMGSGATYRYYSPNNTSTASSWNTATTGQCYNLNPIGADTWGACTNHTGDKTVTNKAGRALDY